MTTSFRDLFERKDSDEPILLASDGKTKKNVDSLTEYDVVGLYFSAHWCPPCRGFTPQLAKIYREIKKEKKTSSLEIVFVSSDRDEASFQGYFNEMPWMALNYSEREIKQTLSERFEVQGIPTLVLINGKTGELLTKNGRALVSAHGIEFPTKALNAKKEREEALERMKDLSQVLGTDDVKTAKTVVVAFGETGNRGWTFVGPKLKETCAALSDDVKVFYVPLDERPSGDSDAPWTELKPRHNIDVFTAAVSDGVIQAPHILVLDAKDGRVLVEDAARSCYETGADGFPWNAEGLARFKKKKADRIAELRKRINNLAIFGADEIVDENGTAQDVATVRARADVVGLYFSAHWCGPCRQFTPQLAKIYRDCRDAGKRFEIIFVSSDSDKSQFDGYFKDMPWLALRYENRTLKEELSEIFGVEGIPTLVLLNADGTEIARDGRARVSGGVDAFPFTDDAINKVKTKDRKSVV